MEVCQVCGAFLIVGDAQQRIDDHLMGKQHVGFAKLKLALDEITAQVQSAKEERRVGRVTDDRRSREQDRDRERERDREKRREKEMEKNRSGHRYDDNCDFFTKILFFFFVLRLEKEKREKDKERKDREREAHRMKERERERDKERERERKHRSDRDSGNYSK